MENIEKDGIVPDVIDALPVGTIEVQFSPGVEVNLGNELTPTQVKNIPIRLTWPSHENTLYTLALLDPDAPSRSTPLLREVKHWLVVNIPGNNVADGVTLAEYIGSAPPKWTGFHRYVFLVYQQAGLIDVTNEPMATKTSKEGRWRFRMRDFAQKHELGEPIACNFYIAQYDDYVLTARRESGGISFRDCCFIANRFFQVKVLRRE